MCVLLSHVFDDLDAIHMLDVPKRGSLLGKRVNIMRLKKDTRVCVFTWVF